MKKILAFLLALVMALSLAACGDPEPTEPPASTPTTPPTSTPTNPATNPPASTPTNPQVSTPTDPTSETPTDAPTVPSTDAPTEPPTEPATDAPTNPPTEPSTDPAMTADELLKLMDNADGRSPLTEYSISFGLEMDIAVKQGEELVEMDLGIGIEMEALTDPIAQTAYVENTTFISMMGISMEQVIENYTVMEDGVPVEYTYQAINDSWTRRELDIQQDTTWEDLSVNTVYEGVILDGKTQTLDGVEVYVLRCENIPDMAQGIAQSLVGTEGLDTANAKFPAVIYVDAQTYRTLQIEIDMTACAEMISQVMATDALGELSADATIESTMTDVVVCYGYGPVDVPEVPQEAYDYLAGGADCPLVCGEITYNVVPPEGWFAESLGGSTVIVTSPDGSVTVYYLYLPGEGDEDILNMMESDVKGLTGADLYVSHGEGPAIEGYKTREVIGKGVRTYFTWDVRPEGCLLVYIMDYSLAEDPTVQLQTMVDAMNPVE